MARVTTKDGGAERKPITIYVSDEVLRHFMKQSGDRLQHGERITHNRLMVEVLEDYVSQSGEGAGKQIKGGK